MKRLSLLLTMCVLIIAQTTRAIVIDDGCLKFSITGGAATVISSDRYVKNIVIPDTIWDDYNKSYPVVAIGSSAFSYPESQLTSIIIPNTVKKIDNNAFFNCGYLSSVSIGSSVETIGENAFCGCASLTSIRIPYSAKSIGVNAFYGCRNLRFVDIPGTIQKMDSSAFDYSHSELVVSIYFMNLDDFSKYVQRDATSFRTACPRRIYFRENEQTEVTIPNSVTKIGANVFLQWQKITSFTIPNSVTSIGDFAFYRCSGLTSITIPNSVTSIGQDAFNGCASLTSVTIPNSVTSIGSRAFEGCNLKSLLCYAKTIPTCDGALVSDYSNCTLYVYKNSISAYKKASVWKNFTNIASIESYEWQRLLSEYETTYNANSKYNNKFPEAAAEFYAIIQNGKKKEPTTVTEEDIDELNEAYRRYLGSLGYVTRISLNESACNICIGNTLQLTAKVSPENAVDSSVSWASDNPSIATVDETGLVTAIAEGEATIMCNANDGCN